MWNGNHLATAASSLHTQLTLLKYTLRLKTHNFFMFWGCFFCVSSLSLFIRILVQQYPKGRAIKIAWRGKQKHLNTIYEERENKLLCSPACRRVNTLLHRILRSEWWDKIRLLKYYIQHISNFRNALVYTYASASNRGSITKSLKLL